MIGDGTANRELLVIPVLATSLHPEFEENDSTRAFKLEFGWKPDLFIDSSSLESKMSSLIQLPEDSQSPGS